MKKFIFTVADFLRILYQANYLSYKKYIHLKRENVAILRILGNGKSLQSIDLDVRSNTDYMVVNRHVIDDSYCKIQPSYYVLADPYFFIAKEGLSILQKINDYTSWNMTLFVPHGINKKIILSIFSNKKIQIIYYNNSQFRGYRKIKYFLYDKALAMPLVQNVLVGAIMIGILMKYETIELFGVEHSWTRFLTVGDDNLTYLEDAHFYDKQVIEKKTVYSLGNKPFSFGFLLQCYSKMFLSYEAIRDYIKLKKNDTKIINKTPGSFIDAFDRF